MSNVEIAIDEYPLGERIRFHRKKRGLTQKHLAIDCKITQGAISLIEAGQSTPSLGHLKIIAATLGTHIARLFAADDVPVLELRILRKRYKSWSSLPPSLRKQLKAVKSYIDSLD
jgi:transcriptional regulator with XRE-family HTH domain